LRKFRAALTSIPSVSIAPAISILGPIAVETVRVIGAAMGKAGVAGIGRLTLSRRERMAMIKPRGPGMALSTLRSADEVRAAQFAVTEGEFDQEMVAIAEAIIRASLLMRLAGQISLPALPKMDQNYA
jgi:hypothetical protein